MARQPMTWDETRASRPAVDRIRITATTEADIRRNRIEDGEDPDARLPPFRPVPNVRGIRTKLRRTPQAFAKAMGVPLATVRNWEQSRTSMDPAVRSLLLVVEREPVAALRALAEESQRRPGHRHNYSQTSEDVVLERQAVLDPPLLTARLSMNRTIVNVRSKRSCDIPLGSIIPDSG